MDSSLQDLADRAVKFASESGAQYCDARAESLHAKSILIEDGRAEYVRDAHDAGIGIRLARGGAWGFCSVTNPTSFGQVRDAVEKAMRSSSRLAGELDLYPSPPEKKTVDFPVAENPDLDTMTEIGLRCGRIISDTPRIIKSVVNPRYAINSKYFASSEGSKIMQSFTDVVMDMAATARESGLTQSVNITEGGRGGMEQIRGRAESSAREISQRASQLVDARPVKEQKGTVVMNPDFVALLAHEILGHPSEADRVMGREMAWAGGAWWRGKIGEKIGSDRINVFDDPTIKESLGWYHYDDEGVRTRKTTLVEDGILKDHMQSRETGKILGSPPTGNMRATSYRFMPLIRMACTCIAPGDYDASEMIGEVKDGYLISNMKIPSIDMKRYNWSISCQYAQRIEGGEVTDLLRDVIVTGTAPEFLESVDACGNDFAVRPITNCGKGDPMQSMVMGNGGPSIRGIATVRSG